MLLFPVIHGEFTNILFQQHPEVPVLSSSRRLDYDEGTSEADPLGDMHVSVLRYRTMKSWADLRTFFLSTPNLFVSMKPFVICKTANYAKYCSFNLYSES